MCIERIAAGSEEYPVSSRPLVIVDNGLSDTRGHHLSLATTLLEAAIKAGQRVAVYAHRFLDPALLPDGVLPRGVFSVSPYEAMARGERGRDLTPEIVTALDRVVSDFPSGASAKSRRDLCAALR
jgi:hypothetical protein